MRKIKTMLPFLTVIALSYCFLPLLIAGIGTLIVILFVAIPLVCLVCSIAYSINNSLNIFYPVFVVILSVILIIRFPLIWDKLVISSLVYGIIALLGNAIGMIFFKRNVRIKNIDKYSRYMIIAVVSSYIVAVIVSSIMMCQMTQITYNATAYGITIRKDIIDFDASKSQRNYYDYYGELTNHDENTLDTAKKFKIKLICSLSLFPLWQESYNNPSIMDGDCYNIIQSYEKDASTIYGSNAYPLTYQLVMMVFENAVA